MTISTAIPVVNRDESTELCTDAQNISKSVGALAEHTANALGGMAQQAACQVGEQADALTARAGSGIEQLGTLMSEHSPHDGIVGNAAQAMAHTVQQGGRYLEEAKLSGATETLTQLIRQHPVTAVIGGIAAGYLLAKAMRNSA